MDPPSGPKTSGIFSSLSLGRAGKANKESTTLAHPLLGASPSSLNLATAEGETADAGPSTSPTGGHSRKGSWTTKPSDPTASSGAVGSLPYKPRQRHGRDASSSSLTGALSPSGGATSPIVSPVNPSIGAVSTSPVASSTFSAPTTSASTSSTFALPPSTATATADMSASVDLLAGYSATSRLQIQSLKAAAQTIGLGNGSMGMSMVDSIFEKGQLGRAKSAEGGDWGEILRVLTAGKAILLLPTTPASSLPMTPQTLRDHIVFLSPPVFASAKPVSSRRSSSTEVSEKGKEVAQEASFMVLTLSGLLGVLRGNSVTFEATLPSDHRLLQSLRDATTRSGILSSLRPSYEPSTLSSHGYPSFPLSAETCSLPFPPLGKGAPPAGSEGKKDEKPTAKLARINPFASFFGNSPNNASSSTVPNNGSPSKAAGTPERPLSPAGGRATSPRRPSSPRPSILSAELQDISSIHSDAGEAGDGFNITAYTVSKPIRYAEVHKAIGKSTRALVREELHRLPDKIVDRVVKLVVPSVAPAGASQAEPLTKSQPADEGGIALDLSSPIKSAERLQDFMESIYDELLAHYRSDNSLFVDETGTLKRKPSGSAPWSRRSSALVEDTPEAKKERREKSRRDREEAIDKEASDGTELAEGVICRLLYNRLFSPLESDDSRHDEALASRIAALNMLDLSLDHLGLITAPEDELRPGQIASGLNTIVDLIGDELQKLATSSCLTPKEKMDVLIKAHKLVVDGLAELPNIELRPEGEPYKASPIPTDVDNTPRVEKSSFDSSLDGFKITLNPAEESLENGDSPKTPEEEQLAGIDVERTPIALRTTSSPTVPSLVLPESDPTSPSADADDIQAAMSTSVLLSAPMSQSNSKSSQASSTKPAGTSGADLILPIIIFAVVKSNPAQLASQLMYLRRYRSAICLTGEASYALVNLTAVVEFLEHVELADLGLGGDSDKVISVADLSPIGLNYLDESNADAASIASASSRLRGRVFQVGELAGSAAGSANKVITGVIDSSWSAVRGLISPTVGFPVGGGGTVESAPEVPADGSIPEPNRPNRPRQQSTFSLASVTASVANIAAAAAASTAAARTRSRASSRASELAAAAAGEKGWGSNQEMIEVSSRPESIRERESEYPSSPETSDEEDEKHDKRGRAKSDARSIRSVSSMMSKEGKREERDKERVSLSDRLANIGALGRFGNEAGAVTTPPAEAKPGFFANLASTRAVSGTSGSGGQTPNTHTRRGSLLSGSPDRIRASLLNPSSPPITSSATLPATPIDPPLEQFMNCEVGDMRLSDIGMLLRDYRRLGNIVNALNAKSAPT